MRKVVLHRQFTWSIHPKLRVWVLRLLCFAALFAKGFAGFKDTEPTGENSVPLSMSIEYFSTDGKSFRLFRDDVFTMENRVCIRKTETRYVINHPFEEDAREVILEIPVKDWISFRQALRSMKLEKMNRLSSEAITIKTSVWTVSIEYPDIKISFEVIDSPSERDDFAPLRKAIYALTKGKWPAAYEVIH